MATRTITVHDRCTKDGCGRVLHGIAEGERGTCGVCWFKAMTPQTKAALNKVIASAFNGSSEAERGKAVENAMEALNRETR